VLLFWRIRYLDSRDKQFKDRDLLLDTDRLDPVTKAAVELCSEMERPGGGRAMLRYRHLFREEKHSGDELNKLVERHGGMNMFCVPEYFEDENGKELTRKQMGVILTGDPNAVMFPAGTKQHDIEFMFTPKPDVDLDQIKIPQADLNALAYFSRDFREMKASSFMAEGPGTLAGAGWIEPFVQTATSDDEIKSFVAVFRRLYMTKEPGNFLRAVKAFAQAILPHPVAKWVQGVAGEYEKGLNGVPDMVPFAPKDGVTFKRKRLIDVFLNTQYAHQGEERRESQYAECLAQVGGRQAVLFWLFLKSMWECALYIHNAGVQIASFTEQYCKCHRLTPSVVAPAAEYAGLGKLEKRRDRKARILTEKAEELARTLWKKAGHPEGGPTRFFGQALAQLRTATGEPEETAP